VSARREGPGGISRRRFVTLLAAGSAALAARPIAAATPASAKPRAGVARARTAAPAMSAATRRELERQRAATLETLKAIRAHRMPPGTELASVFRARRPARKGR